MWWLRMAIALGVAVCAGLLPDSDVLAAVPDQDEDQRSTNTEADVPDDGHRFTGRHLLASYCDCDTVALRDRARLLRAMREAVLASGATLLKSCDYSFPGGGLTAVMLLSESHASVHTYPEHRACFVDLFTCGESCSAEAFDRVLTAYLRPRSAHRRTLLRHQRSDEDTFREQCFAESA